MICASCRQGGRLGQLAAERAHVIQDVAAPPRIVVDPMVLREAAAYHAQCIGYGKGQTWCDCQHEAGTKLRADRKADPRRGA